MMCTGSFPIGPLAQLLLLHRQIRGCTACDAPCDMLVSPTAAAFGEQWANENQGTMMCGEEILAFGSITLATM